MRRRLPLLGARAFFSDPVRYVRSQPRNGAALRFAAGPSRYALARDPDAIWRVLVTDGAAFQPGKWKRRARRFVGPTLNTLHGEEHRERRRLLGPSVARRRVDELAPAMAMRADRAQAGWEPGARIVLRDALDPLSLAMAGDVLLSADLEDRAPRLAGALAEVMAAVPRLSPPLRFTRRGRALAEVDAAIAALIDRRRRQAGAEPDLLGALLAGGFSQRTVRGEVLAFLLAAVDEPPSALESAWWLLGRNPGAEARLHAELDGVLDGGAPQLEDARRLPYLDAVLRETLRLFPPARHIDRCPVSETRIGGEPVRAGTNVLISPLVTHRDPLLHRDPEAFSPERWLGDEKVARGAYLPFGAGVHTCIGEPLARAIMTLTLAAVARHWKLQVDPNAPAPVPRAPRLTVRLERR